MRNYLPSRASSYFLLPNVTQTICEAKYVWNFKPELGQEFMAGNNNLDSGLVECMDHSILTKVRVHWKINYDNFKLISQEAVVGIWNSPIFEWLNCVQSSSGLSFRPPSEWETIRHYIHLNIVDRTKKNI